MMQIQLMILRPAIQIGGRHAPVAKVGQFVHQKSVAGRSAQGIDDVDFSSGYFSRSSPAAAVAELNTPEIPEERQT